MTLFNLKLEKFEFLPDLPNENANFRFIVDERGRIFRIINDVN